MMYCQSELKTQFIMNKKKIATKPSSVQSIGCSGGLDRS